MIRFFVCESELLSENPTLSGENAKHAKVLRLKPGEEVVLCDGENNECICSVEEVEADSVYLKVLSRRKGENEAAVKVSIFAALPKADKLEHIIQKATELGAYEIVTFPTARCIAKLDEKALVKKLERWQKIAESAAKQSMRGYIPKVRVLKNYKAALDEVKLFDKAILFYENEHALTLKTALKQSSYKSIGIITGPEGGFEQKEVDLARENDIQICTLGKRILRCETAPLCALSAIMYDSDEF